MPAYTGELAALTTSLLFSATSTIFTFAGRQVGSYALNRGRLLLAVLFLTVAHFILKVPLPIQAGGERWFWLGLSGVVGLALGDAFLFQAFVWVGPRLSMLMMSLAPMLSALLAWIFMGESLNPGQTIGMTLTLGGVAWVVLERNGHNGSGTAQGEPNFRMGILFGLAAAICQAGGLILAKAGAGGDFSALSGTLIRMVVAAIVLWGFSLASGRAGTTLRELAGHRSARLLILGGALTGPTLGVTFSLLAIQHAAVGVASTLMALPPVILLPVGYFLFEEKFGWQAIVGTLLAISGVGVLFLT